MPTNVQDLDLLTSELTNQELLVMDSAFDLYRAKVANFRGAGLFTGTEAPPSETHPNSSDGFEYKNGDQYISIDGTARVLYTWDSAMPANSRWIDNGSLIGTRRLTVESFPDNKFETTRSSVEPVTPAEFVQGDTYYNTTLDKTFGPHDGTQLMDFSLWTWPRSYRTERGARQLTHPVNYAPERNLHTWHPAFINDDTEAAYAPQHGDTYYQPTEITQAQVDADFTDTVNVTQSPLHGGWIFTWDEVTFGLSRAAGDPYLTSLILGWTTIPKIPARQPKHFLSEVPPTVDDMLYIDGDSFTNQLRGLLYTNYRTNTLADRDAVLPADLLQFVWGNQVPTSVKSTVIHDLTNRIADDNVYGEGDFGYHRNQSTMYGPYVSGAPSNELSWPINSVARPWEEYVLPPQNTFVDVAVTYASEADIIFNGAAVDAGDRMIVPYTSTTPTTSIRTATWVCTLSTGGVITWAMQNESMQNKSWTAANEMATSPHGQPPRNDVRYFQGDMFYVNGDEVVYGPYQHGKLTDAEAWPLHTLTRSIEHTITAAGLPAISSLDVDWTPRLRHGDTILLNWTGSTTGKQERYHVVNPNINADGLLVGVSDWGIGDTHNPNPSNTHTSGLAGQPLVNDANFSDGDFIKNIAGDTYGPYNINHSGTNTLAWPLLNSASSADYIDATSGVTYTIGFDNGILQRTEGSNTVDIAGQHWEEVADGWTQSDVRSYSVTDLNTIIQHRLGEATEANMNWTAADGVSFGNAVTFNSTVDFNNGIVSGVGRLNFNDAGAGEGIYFSPDRASCWGIEETNNSDIGDMGDSTGNGNGYLHFVQNGKRRGGFDSDGTLAVGGHLKCDNNIHMKGGNIESGATSIVLKCDSNTQSLKLDGNGDLTITGDEFKGGGANLTLLNKDSKGVYVSGSGDFRPKTHANHTGGGQNLGHPSTAQWKTIYGYYVKANDVILSSDERAKDFGEVVDHRKLRGIVAKNYTWNGKLGMPDGVKAFGFSAQEMMKLYPEIVKVDKSNNDFHGIDYSKLVGPLVNYCNDLQNQNDTLSDRVAELEKLVEGILTKL